MFGEAMAADVVHPEEMSELENDMIVQEDVIDQQSLTEINEIRRLDTSEDARWRKKLMETVPLLELLDPAQKKCHRTWKRAPQKHEVLFSRKWDHYLSGILWVYIPEHPT